MIFQQPNPFPQSIYDNVAYGPRLQGVRKKSELDGIVEDSLKRANLWKEVKDILGKNGLALSGGQQQRLCIARVLAVEPEVLLMDEPCSAIDPTSVQKIEDLMAELKETVTIVIVTHNMQQAARVSDYTAFFLQEVAGEPAVLVECRVSGDDLACQIHVACDERGHTVTCRLGYRHEDPHDFRVSRLEFLPELLAHDHSSR